MAITRSSSWSDAVLDAGRTFFQQIPGHMRNAAARRKVYRATYHELARLSDRDLADVGIHRADIGRLAWETAYGQ